MVKKKKTVGQRIDNAFDTTGDVVGNAVDRKVNFWNYGYTYELSFKRWEALVAAAVVTGAALFFIL